jgi:uncharacterized protein YutD
MCGICGYFPVNRDQRVEKPLLQRMNDTIGSSNVNKQLSKIEKDIHAIEQKRHKLVDMRLEDSIDKNTYEEKYSDILGKLEQLVDERKSLQVTSDNEKDIKKRLVEFKKTLEHNEVLDEFDRYVFESIVEKVIVGGVDEDGNKDPFEVTFIYKTGFSNKVDGTKFKPIRRNSKTKYQTDELCSYSSDEVNNLCSHYSDDTR